MGYLVAVKGSARRASSGAGEWVHRRGPHREFQSKDEAREWARELSTPGYTCWVQDANPLDDSDVDGYLVAARYGRKGDGEADGQGDGEGDGDGERDGAGNGDGNLNDP